MPRLIILVVLAVAVGVGAVVAYQSSASSWSIAGPSLSADQHGIVNSSRALESSRSVVALARLEPAGGAVEVSNMLIGDTLVALVEEGTFVKQGEELGRLDPTFRKIDVDLATARYAEASENLDAERATAQTRLSSATLALRQATEGAAIELEAQEKRVEFLRLDLQQAGNDLARLATLSKSSDSIVSEQQLEHQQLLRDKSAAETDSAEAALKQLQQAARFDQETAEANVRAAEVALEAVDKRSNLQALKVQLQLAQERLGRTVIIAPISGTVLKIYTRVGESIAEKPVLQMADLSKFDCVAEVFEADIKLVSVGDLVQVRSRAFLGSFDDTYVTGRVKRIGNAMPNRELTPISPLEPVDKHVVQVEIDLADKTKEMVELLGESDIGDVLDKAQALVNLEVEVTFPEQSELSVSGLAR